MHQLVEYNPDEHHPAAYYPVDHQSVEHNLAKQYRIKKNKLTFSERKHDRKFMFGLNITEQNPTNFNVFDGIFVIKNTVGLPNNINLFDFKKENKINESIREFSKLFVDKLFMEDIYNTLALSALLDVITKWFTANFPNKLLNLTIIDNTCRVPCATRRIS